VADFMKQIERELGEDRELAKLTGQEELILNVTELVLEKMEQKGVSKSQLADMLDTNKSHITQLLRGSRNMTLRTVSDIFFELDCKLIIDAVPSDECYRQFMLTESEPFVVSDRITDWNLYKQLKSYQGPKSNKEAMAA
jgi:ribosome-binding protein aMBF1 (putative translation factor)